MLSGSEVEPPSGVPWRAIAFDLDDTLYPEVEFVRSGFRQIAAWSREKCDFEEEATYRELIDLFAGGVRGTVFNEWLALHALPLDLVPEMVTIYREHIPVIEPFPQVPKLLTELGDHFRLGLLSDGVLATQERKLSALGIESHFDAVVFSDRLGRDCWKPSVEPFLELIRLLHVIPGEAVYVADNPAKDFIACHKLGMHSIWLHRHNGIYSNYPTTEYGHQADFVVDSIDGVRKVLYSGGTI